MQQINVNELKAHPRNNEFFDDMTGEKWTEFLESIRTSGVIEPIVITPDKVIISGHQRVRACKELGIADVLTDMRDYSDEDKILKDLIETNIRQRGIGNPNPVKLGRCIKELERIYGIHQGNGSNQYEQNPKLSDNAKTSQEQLADMIGISVDTLSNYKKLTELVPELQDWVETGILAPTTAIALVRCMSPDEQEEFVKSMDRSDTDKEERLGVEGDLVGTDKEEQRYKNPNVKAIKEHDVEYLRAALAHEPMEIEDY